MGLRSKFEINQGDPRPSGGDSQTGPDTSKKGTDLSKGNNKGHNSDDCSQFDGHYGLPPGTTQGIAREKGIPLSE